MDLFFTGLHTPASIDSATSPGLITPAATTTNVEQNYNKLPQTLRKYFDGQQQPPNTETTHFLGNYSEDDTH
jgi:hypothetical protein